MTSTVSKVWGSVQPPMDTGVRRYEVGWWLQIGRCQGLVPDTKVPPWYTGMRVVTTGEPVFRPTRE